MTLVCVKQDDLFVFAGKQRIAPDPKKDIPW
jgi:hypothetical protein